VFGVEVLLLLLFAVPNCSSWLDPYPLLAIAVDRGTVNPAMSRMISIALSLCRLIFVFFIVLSPQSVYYDVRLKGHCETSVSTPENSFLHGELIRTVHLGRC
jgi:hypothetical protein